MLLYEVSIQLVSPASGDISTMTDSNKTTSAFPFN